MEICNASLENSASLFFGTGSFKVLFFLKFASALTSLILQRLGPDSRPLHLEPNQPESAAPTSSLSLKADRGSELVFLLS